MTSSRRRQILTWLAITIVAFGVGYAASQRVLFGPLAGLRANDGLTLYSLEPTEVEPGKEAQNEEQFHGYPVLGKIEIAEPTARREIISSMKWGVAGSNRFRFKKCFWPRHGIRAVTNGTVVDLVICFQCDRVVVYRGETGTSESISDTPKQLLNEHLTSGGVPLAPEDVEPRGT